VSGAAGTGALAIAAAVRAGQRRAVDVAQAALGAIAVRDTTLKAFTAVTAARALAAARAVDAAVAAGRDPGPLAGVPYAVKNLCDISGLPTLAGSKINRARAPAAGDAAAIRRLDAAGAVLVGALNMGEYAYDFTGENAHDGPSRNPHDPTRMSGGSSGGSGAAVGGGLVPLAVGSDTNGSIRVPSSLCGIFGLKATFGRVSRAGTFPFVASLDHIGPFARSAADLAAAYDALQGHDPDDPVSADRPADPAGAALARGAAGLRIAVADGFFETMATAPARAAVARAATALGATRRVSVPMVEEARAAAFLITAVEGASLHAERLRTRPQDFDPATRDRFLAGLLVPGHWYMRAQRVRRQYQAAMRALFAEIDILLTPATPCAAPALGQETMVLGDGAVPVRATLGLFTQPFSFVGLPAAVAPIPLDPLPVGVQIVAAPWREVDVLRVAAALEAAGAARAPDPKA
jgi:aspartyl-tRNA(Asn)/glutamyl-tRNA(Gln) amidotransferase subunit A